jgi:RNA polymerase sigma-54 factor
MNPKLHQTQSQVQKLTLSPQIKVYLKILQMPLLELKQNLEEEMMQNPVLEEEITAEGELSNLSEETPAPEKPEDWEKQNEDLTETNDSEENLIDVKELERRKKYQESLITQQETLADHLHNQISLLDLTDLEKEWAEEVVGNLDEKGYLAIPLPELASQLKVPEKKLEGLLKKLQTVEPAGIFARDLAECLLLQLERREGPAVLLAERMITEQFPLLEKRNFPQLEKTLQAPSEAVGKAFHLIQELDPKPGLSFVSSKPFEVIPDALITCDENNPKKFQIEIKETGLSKLKLSAEYRKMMKDKALDETAKKFIREKVNQATWLLEALENRKVTLAAILKTVFEKQPEFLEKGFGALKPLRMKEVADVLGIHESTVSRAVAGKYIQTSRGTFPLRKFFSGKIASGPDSEESQKSVMEKIKHLIGTENPKKPLSDQKIAESLSQDGIQVARRTVAKYREMMKILPTSLRRKR